jgi:hypothetical protein
MTHYRNRHTGRFASAATWRRSKAKGGTRYVRESAKPRTRRVTYHRRVSTSRKVTRLARTPAQATRELPREFLITLDYKNRKRGFHADLLITAPVDSTPTDLADYARKHLPSGKSFLANWIEGSYSKISKGDFVDRKPSLTLRAFRKRKR